MTSAVSNPFRIQVNAQSSPPVNDVWTRIDTPSSGGTTSQQGWTWSAINNVTRKIFVPNQGNKLFNLVTNVWETVSANLTPTGVFENAAYCCEETTGKYLRGGGGPVGYTGSIASLPSWAGNEPVIFDPALGWSDAGYAEFNIDAMFAWLSGTFYRWGGFTIGGGQALYTKTSIGGSWVAKNPTGAQPTFGVSGAADNTGARVTWARGGVDSRTGQVWVFADDNELFVWEPAVNNVTRLPTTGTKPPFINTMFALHEAANAIVGFCGQDYTVGGGAGTGTVARQTYILDLATLHWRLGPGAAGTVPPANVYVQYFGFHYDRVAQRVILIASNAVQGAEVWSLVLEETPL